MKRIALFSTALLLISGVANAAPFQTSQAASAVAVAARPGAPDQESVPRLVQFNGTFKDSALRPIAGVASVTFAIYAEQDGGTALWSETQNVLADGNGHYNVLLGAATSNGVPADLFGTGQSRWLSVAIARQPEMPRVLLASVPYALKAADADTLGGLPASSYVTTQQLAASSARVVAGGTTTIIAAPSAAASTTQAATDFVPPSGPQATPTGGGTANFIPLWTSTTNLGNSKIFQASGGFVGINTTTPELQLDVNGNSIFRGSVQLPPQGTATASTGQPSRSFQYQASVFNSSTNAAQNEAFAFRAVPSVNNTSAPTAKFDLFYGPGGGTLTDLGLSISHTGTITFAPGQTFGGSVLALPNTTSSTNGVITLGGSPFLSNLGSSSNAFVGALAGGTVESAGNAIDNTAMGSFALGSDTVGFNNTAIGSSALNSATVGSYNTAVGEEALENTTTGGSNVAIGYFSGNNNTTGGLNVFIGANAGPSSGNLNNAVAIGSGATVGVSGAIVLGGTGASASKVGINTTEPSYTLEVVDEGGSGAGFAAFSSVAGDNAVFGNSLVTSGLSNGGYFTTSSSVGSGVVGVNTAGGKAGYFGGTVEVAGLLQVDGSETVGGNLAVAGNVSKLGGSFKIDDPIDPANKYLSHSFVESPDMMNIYNGIVVLDAKGAAWVTMPEWFGALNQDFRYQLTSIGRPGPSLFIAREVKNNRFKIAGGRPGARVSWQVTGIRHDAWANAHRIPTEELKPGDEQGRYLRPELFGAPADRKINAQKHDAPPSDAASAAHSSSQNEPQGQK